MNCGLWFEHDYRGVLFLLAKGSDKCIELCIFAVSTFAANCLGRSIRLPVSNIARTSIDGVLSYESDKESAELWCF